MPTILKRADLARAYRDGHAGLLRYHGYEVLVGPMTLGGYDEYDSFATVRDVDGLPALSIVHRWAGDMVDQHAEHLGNDNILITRAELLMAHAYAERFISGLDRRHERDIRHDHATGDTWHYGADTAVVEALFDKLLAHHAAMAS